MTSVTFDPAARVEMLNAVDWYNAHASGIGDRFLGEIDTVVARLAENPRQFPVVFKDIRRARLHRFPYGLFFRVEVAGIHVLACFHSNRDPRRWQERS
jgi:plasmid stabilization system protein ParE